MINRFKIDVRLKDYLISKSFTKYDEIPRLHRRNEKWLSPRSIDPIEDCLKEFEENISKENRKRKNLKGSNLTKLQQNTLNVLKNKKQHVALIADKSIAPCIANRNDHIAAMTKQHFRNYNIHESRFKE